MNGPHVTITPSGGLSDSKSYHIEIDAGAFEDEFGNAYAGVSDSTTWNFSTGTAVALDITDFCDTVTAHWDGTDAAAFTVTSGPPDVIDAWETSDGSALSMTATLTARPQRITDGIRFDGSNDVIQLNPPGFTAPNGRASVWVAARSTSDTSVSLITHDGSNVPRSLAWSGRRDPAVEWSVADAEAQQIIVHPGAGPLATTPTNSRGRLMELLGGGTPADVVMEYDMYKMQSDGWDGFGFGGYTTFASNWDLYQMAVVVGCDTFERRHGMLAFLQSKIP